MNRNSIFLGLLTVLPCLAQDGFTVGVGVGQMKANVDNPAMAAITGITTPGGYGYSAYTHTYADYADHTPLLLHLGYAKGINSINLDVQSSSAKGNVSLSDPNSLYWISSGLNAPYDVGTRLEATLYDLTWGRTLSEGSGGTWGMSLGLRAASFDQRVSVVQTVGDPQSRWSLESRTRTDVFGILAGVDFRCALAANLDLKAGAKVAYVAGDEKGRTESIGVNNDMYLEGRFKDKTFLQSELGLNLTYHFNAVMEASLGYRFQDFGQVGGEPQPEHSILRKSGPDESTNSNGGWGLNGWTFGVGFHF